ncbi:ATP-binding protein [Streptomyces griseorubiginosus]|uniref:ATP-binding protein n=1 Tax=Streptomyces griseorubiginosus TaxID=67304 RepID=UPI0033181F31
MSREIQPLEALSEADSHSWAKQRIINIIKSYHNPTDVLAEPIQNAVDEVLSAEGIMSPGKVTIEFNTDTNEISVIDNGRGISSNDIARYLAPDIGTKRAAFKLGLVRGHKGVGMTFLAYGFDFFALESRTQQEHYILQMSGGRSWASSDSDDSPPPVGQLEDVTGGGSLTETGTRVTIRLGPKTQPRDLKRSFPTIAYAATVIQTQTAVGIVQPPNIQKKRELSAEIRYIHNSHPETLAVTSSYRYPHMLLPNGVQVLSLNEWFAKSRRTEPAARDKGAYHACYKVYSPNELIGLVKDGSGDILTSSQEVEEFIREHDVHVYSLFAYGAAYRDTVAKAWGITGNRKTLHAPRLRVATDGMISSWSREMTLVHRGFNVDRTWLVFQLKGIEPDMGRKDFPPDLHDFLEIAEEKVANDTSDLSKPFLRPSPPRTPKTPEGNINPSVKAAERLAKPLVPSSVNGIGKISLLTEPESEQDVIALFSELVGMRVLSHFKPVFYSGFDYYDSYFRYVPGEACEEVTERLPGEEDVDPRDIDGVAEFKLFGDWIISDIVNKVKRWDDMRFLVCWKIGRQSRRSGGDEIYFNPVDNPVDRRFHGVTHLATLQSAGSRPVFVISLWDLLNAMNTE